MSQWQIFKGVNGAGSPVQDGEQFDDGIWAGPGEDGFTNEHVVAEMKARGADSYSYIGRTTQVQERTEAAIAPVAEGIAEGLRTQAAEQIARQLVDVEPPDIEAAVAEQIDARAEEFDAAARAAALKNMGLAEA